MIDISKYEKAEVFAALYNHSRRLGLDISHYDPITMTKKEAEEILEIQEHFKYFMGRVMQIDLSQNQLDPTLYNRDNGPGAAEAAIKTIGI